MRVIRVRACENFLYGFKAAPRAARAADSDGTAALPLRSARLASGAGRLARKAKNGAAETRGSHGAAADLTRGPLAAAPSGYEADLEGRPIAGKRTAAAPCVKSAAR